MLPLLLLLPLMRAAGLLQQQEFREISRLSAADADAVQAAFLNDAPFVIEGLISAESRSRLFAGLEAAGEEEVKVSAYVREPLPHSQQSTRLMPREERPLPLRDFLHGSYRRYFSAAVRDAAGESVAFQLKRKVDFRSRSYRSSPFEKLYCRLMAPKDATRLLNAGTLAGGKSAKAAGRWKASDPIIRLQAHPFTYPSHFDCYHNLLVQLWSTKRFVLFPPDAPSLRQGFAELDELATMFERPAPSAADRDVRPAWVDQASQATLHAGDAIFVPIHWYHAVENHQNDSAAAAAAAGAPGAFASSVNFPLQLEGEAYAEVLRRCDEEFRELYTMQRERLDQREDYRAGGKREL